jgi:hypothetical protein
MGIGMADNNNNNLYIGTVYFHDGTPVPELLTEQEVLKFLRLDTNGPANPHETLKYYRDEGLLRATRISKKYLYQKKEVLLFLDRLTARTNGKKTK